MFKGAPLKGRAFWYHIPMSHKRIIQISLAGLAVLIGILYIPSFVSVETLEANNLSYKITGELPQVSASSYLVFDIETGEHIVEHEGNIRRPIASVTKLISAVSLRNTANLEATTTITYDDVATEGRAGKLVVGEIYTLRELRLPLLLESSNDAATVMERVTNGAVVNEMNNLAQAHGVSARFLDASGLSAKNIASAEDLAVLANYIYEVHPDVFDITKVSQYIGEYTGWFNNNPGKHIDGYQGGKHGYTEAAGRTILNLYKHDFPSESRVLGYVLLNSANLKADLETLHSYVAGNVIRE